VKVDYRSHEQEYFLEVMVGHEADESLKIRLLLTVWFIVGIEIKIIILE
jgi:hypothetical protein